MSNKQYNEVELVALNQIEHEIYLLDQTNVCNHMAAAGMYSDDLDNLYYLIDICCKSENEWIRNAGFIALYHLNFRFREEIDSSFLIDILKKGLADKSAIVTSTLGDIMDDLEMFNPAAWQLFHHKE